MSDLADLMRFRKQHPEQSAQVRGARWGVIDSATGARANSSRTLVLLPGTLGTAEIFWQQMRALSRQVRLIAFTYPAVPDVERFADGIAEILRVKGIRITSLLGSSLGGYTAQLVAARHPELVERLFIGNSLCDPHASWRPRNPPLEELEAMPARDLKAERVARVNDWPESDPGLALAKRVIGMQGREMISARHLKARVLALLRAQNAPPLSLPTDRIAIIDCADDPVMPPAARQEVRDRYPGATVHTLPTGGHFPYISRPGPYTDILRQHLLR
ncbi:MAG TPA: alpha/beta hydrolase [bacterium]|nr:alpha/beta hydrolase [bacterium]